MAYIGQPIQVSIHKRKPETVVHESQSKLSSLTSYSGISGGVPCNLFTIWEPIFNDECNISNEEAWKRIAEQEARTQPSTLQTFLLGLTRNIYNN